MVAVSTSMSGGSRSRPGDTEDLTSSGVDRTGDDDGSGAEERGVQHGDRPGREPGGEQRSEQDAEAAVAPLALHPHAPLRGSSDRSLLLLEAD